MPPFPSNPKHIGEIWKKLHLQGFHGASVSLLQLPRDWYSWCVCIIFSFQRQEVSCQVQLVEGGIFSQRLGNRRMPPQGCMLRPRALMRRKCATAAVWALTAGKRHTQKRHFPPTPSQHRREKQTGRERERMTLQRTPAGSPEPKKVKDS